MEWNGVVGGSEPDVDIADPFESKSFENKQSYNRVVGDLLKLYIGQGETLTSVPESQIVYNPYGIDGLCYDYEYNLNYLEIFKSHSLSQAKISLLYPGSATSIPVSKIKSILRHHKDFMRTSDSDERLLKEFYRVSLFFRIFLQASPKCCLYLFLF